MPIDDSIIDEETAEKRQMWRRLRSAITLLVLVVVVIVGAWVSWRNITSDASTDGAGGPSCAPTVAEDAPKPGTIEVNVYNATGRDGMAAKVSESLRKRGFIIGDVANDPLNRSVEAAAEIRSNLARQAAASVVMSHVSGAAFVSDNRSTKSVDFVIGDDFNDLLSKKQVSAGAESNLPPCDPATD